MNIPLLSIVVIFFSHWVGDYLFQGNIVAMRKRTSLRWLALHVLGYSISLSLFSFIIFPSSIALSFVIWNTGLHFITDLITSRAAVRYEENQRVYHLIIGFDQLIHYTTLIVTAYYLNPH
jgi:hypothetical protein